ncbi:MAG: DUF3955 domain-containing protein [Paracoccaceae bacterium]
MKPRILLILIGLLGVACRVAFSVIGSTIDADGVMHEAFFLLPVSYLLILVGFGGYFLTLLIAKSKQD